MKQLLKFFCNSFSFEDAPVECSTHFLRRLQDFLNEHVLHDKGILGNCTHYVIRSVLQRITHAKAAMICLEAPAVKASSPVDFVASAAPKLHCESASESLLDSQKTSQMWMR
ncbi:hypothetical protein WJX77_012092 [Trebouxia sp. C0004]